MKFATGPVGQAIIAESGLFVPVLKSVLGSGEFAAAHRDITHLDVLIDGPRHSRALPVTPAWGKVQALLERGANRVLRGAAPAASLHPDLTRTVDALLQDTR